MNMFTVTVVGTAQSCSGSNCNNAYVNTELEILEENPVYEPMPVPNPVFDIELCNDLLQPRLAAQTFLNSVAIIFRPFYVFKEVELYHIIYRIQGGTISLIFFKK